MTNTPSKRNKADAEVQYKKAMQEAKVATWVDFKFKEAWAAKQPFEALWKKMELAYFGKEYVNGSKPSYKSDHISNYIFKTIETIRPIMIDKTPIFQAIPRKKSGIGKDAIIQKALQYEYDREEMDVKIASNLIDFLVKGNMIFYLPWDGEDEGGKGNVKAIPVNAFNFFPDPNATSIGDASYVIYATYMHENELKKSYPDKKMKIQGQSVEYKDLQGNRETDSDVTNDRNQVLVLKMFLRDYATTVEQEWDDHGNCLQKEAPKYPYGRQIVCAPQLNMVFEDKKLIYDDGDFPFVHIKNHDIPFEFWGKSDVEQLMSPQKYMNDITNQIIDNARHMANPIWKITNNAGIGKGKLNNRPGLIVRYNQGADVSREAPPGMPAYVFNMNETLKQDVETISGVHESLAGERPVGVQNASAINSLQEAGQARIRMKVKSLEAGIGKLEQKWYNRMQQFWLTDRFVRVTDEDGKITFEEMKKDYLQEEYDIKIIAGSTMPENKAAKMDLMIRLAQTPAEDGFPMVDRAAVLNWVDMPDKRDLLERMEAKAQEVPNEVDALAQEMQAQFKEFGGVVKELSQAVQGINQQMRKLQQEHEAIMQDEKNKAIEEKGYKRGQGEIPPDLQADEQAALQAQRDANFTNQINNGTIPEEVLDELLALPDAQLKQLIQQNPQLAELIQQNLQ